MAPAQPAQSEGMDGHDCGEDSCCCLEWMDNDPCEICRGKGFFMTCAGRCDKDGKHKPKVEKGIQ